MFWLQSGSSALCLCHPLRWLVRAFIVTELVACVRCIRSGSWVSLNCLCVSSDRKWYLLHSSRTMPWRHWLPWYYISRLDMTSPGWGPDKVRLFTDTTHRQTFAGTRSTSKPTCLFWFAFPKDQDLAQNIKTSTALPERKYVFGQGGRGLDRSESWLFLSQQLNMSAPFLPQGIIASQLATSIRCIHKDHPLR